MTVLKQDGKIARVRSDHPIVLKKTCLETTVDGETVLVEEVIYQEALERRSEQYQQWDDGRMCHDCFQLIEGSHKTPDGRHKCPRLIRIGDVPLQPDSDRYRYCRLWIVCRNPVLKTPERASRVWCSKACVQWFLLRSYNGELRRRIRLRDKGFCAACGLDTYALRRRLEKIRDVFERRRILEAHGYRITRKHSVYFWVTHSLWEVDHIVRISEGGAPWDLTNMRALCAPCHHELTDIQNAWTALQDRNLKLSLKNY